jgi:hypothetical protein
MNLSAIIPFLALLKDSGVLSPAPRVPFQVDVSGFTAQQAAEAYVAGVGEKGKVMSWVEWSSRNPGRPITDYHKYVAAFT